VVFTDPLAAANVGTPLNQPLHPTQLYDAGAESLILLLLLFTERRGKPFPGRTFWGYMVLYGVSRFIIEMFRGDPRGSVAGLSTSQFVSVLIVPLSLLMLWRLRARATA
jgi:phosphatidylglycerol:prolipoprotein diacylglycerol transferase